MTSRAGMLYSTRQRQQGATLVVALIFLVVLTMLGITAAQNSAQEERMSGNTRSRDLAFQAAESALTHAQLNLSTGENIRTLTFNDTAGLWVYEATRANDVAYWKAYAWPTNSRQPTTTLNQVASQPLYVVEKMPTVGTTEYYRVTARGIGKEAAAVVILQAIYKLTP